MSLIAARNRPSLALACALALASPHLLAAQAARPWRADVAVGAASVTSGHFFNDAGRAAAQLSLARRVLQRSGLTIYAQASYDWFGEYGLVGSNSDLICVVDRATGGCEPSFPDVAGPSASIGLLYAHSTRVETRIGLGGAAYSVDGTRVGAAVGQLDAAFFPTARVGLMLGAHVAVIPRYRHDRLTLIPVLLGLRVR